MIGRWAVALLVALALGGCGSSMVWETERTIAPVTYASAEDAVARHVGKLRRLALIAAAFDYEPQGALAQAMGSFPKIDEAEIERRLGEALAQRAIRFLVDWRGYDVIDARDRAGDDGENTRRIAAIADWLARASADAVPPAKVAAAAKTLARELDADGLLVIDGWGRQASDAELAAVLGTASLAWPMLYAADKTRLRADIVEGESGWPAWRHVLTRKDTPAMLWHLNEASSSRRTVVEDLFAPLEPALPAVFTVPAPRSAPSG